MEWVIQNWDEIIKVAGLVIAAASIIVRLTPTLRDDSILLPIVKFLGKYVAFNKYGLKEVERPK